jgi:hypothetical protein
VAFATWFVSGAFGTAVAVACAAAWAALEIRYGRPYSSRLIPHWNAAVRPGFCRVVAWLLVAPGWGVGMTSEAVSFLEPVEDVDAMVRQADDLMDASDREGRGSALFATWPAL